MSLLSHVGQRVLLMLLSLGSISTTAGPAFSQPIVTRPNNTLDRLTTLRDHLKSLAELSDRNVARAEEMLAANPADPGLSAAADAAIAERERIRVAVDELQQLLRTLKGSQAGGSAP